MKNILKIFIISIMYGCASDAINSKSSNNVKNNSMLSQSAEDTCFISNDWYTYNCKDGHISVRDFLNKKLPDSLLHSKISSITVTRTYDIDYDTLFSKICSNSKLQEIELNDVNFSSFLKCKIDSIYNIHSLTVLNCKIDNFKFLYKFDSLHYLNLSYDNIFCIEKLYIYNLKYLSFQGNKINSVPDFVFEMNNLEHINLESTLCEALPITITKCKKLRNIYIGATPLSKRVLKYIDATRQNELQITDYGSIQFIKDSLPNCKIHLRMSPVGG